MCDTTILVIGYGNPARGDDGVGPALAARLERLQREGVTVETDYQLSIEHAALAAEHGTVVFADAAVDADEAFYFRPIAAAPATACSSHAVSPGEVLGLARTCFGATPRGYVLGIRGHAMDGFREGLTADAEAALDAALVYLLRFIDAQACAQAGAATPGLERADARRQARHSLHR